MTSDPTKPRLIERSSGLGADMISLVADKDFKYYKMLLGLYHKEMQAELNYDKDPKNIEVAFAVLWDDKPYAWASIKKATLGDGQEHYVLFAPMLISSNHTITNFMREKIESEMRFRGLDKLLHIGLMPQAAEAFGFRKSSYEEVGNLIPGCLNCARRYKTRCNPMILEL